MNKKMIALTLTAAVCSASALAACGGNTGNGGGADASKYVGHWNIKTMEAGGESLDIQSIFNAVGTDSSDTVGLNIKNDGKFTLDIYGNGEHEGTWKTADSNTLILDVDGDEQRCILEGSQLSMSYGEGDSELKLIFEKDGGSSETETSASVSESSAEETTSCETTQEETTASN